MTVITQSPCSPGNDHAGATARDGTERQSTAAGAVLAFRRRGAARTAVGAGASGRDAAVASSALPSAAADRERSVFISCSADAAYRPLLRAMCFTLRACGFVPRCALNHPGTAQASFAEIVGLVAGCDLSIHDLLGGAADGDGAGGTGSPGFRTPLALGVDLALRRQGPRSQRRRRTLLLDAAPHGDERVSFSLLEADVQMHGNDVGKVIARVRDWLNVNREPGTPPLPCATALREDHAAAMELVGGKLAQRKLGALDALGPCDFMFVLDEALLTIADRGR